MDLRVAFTYPIKFIPARCFTDRTALFRAETQITIAERPKSEARPAFHVTFPENVHNPEPEAGPERLIVSWNGRLWIDSGATAAAFEKRFAQETYVSGTPLDAAGHLEGTRQAERYRTITTEAEIKRTNSLPMREWRDDGGAAVAETLARRAEDMVIFGRKIFVRTYEPIWELSYGGEELSVRTSPPDLFDEFGMARVNFLFNPVNCWRADQGGTAARFTGLKANGSITVLDPSQVRYADTPRMLSRMASEAVGDIKAHLHVLPPSVTDVVLDLRDALFASRGHSGPVLPDALRAAAGLGAPDIPAWRLGSGKAAEAYAGFVRTCSEAVARWDDRPRDGREWVERGAKLTASRVSGITVREVLDMELSGSLSRALRADLSDMENAAASGSARLLMAGDFNNARRRYAAQAKDMAAVLVSADGSSVLKAMFSAECDRDAVLAAVAAHITGAADPSKMPPVPCDGEDEQMADLDEAEVDEPAGEYTP